MDAAKMPKGYSVKTSDGFVCVYRGEEIICDAKILSDNRVTGIEFSKPEYRKINRIRIAAMNAIQSAGYR